MNSTNEEKKESYSGKKIKVNSIKDPLIKRILKPCEARAGHGAILIFVYMAILVGLATLVVKGLHMVWRWIFE